MFCCVSYGYKDITIFLLYKFIFKNLYALNRRFLEDPPGWLRGNMIGLHGCANMAKQIQPAEPAHVQCATSEQEKPPTNVGVSLTKLHI